MKRYVFPKNHLGFDKWIQSIPHMKFIIRTYESIKDESIKEWRKEEYLDSKKSINIYSKFRLQLTEDEREYVYARMKHHLAPRRDLKLDDLYAKWEKIVIGAGYNFAVGIDDTTIGNAIKTARELQCLSRKTVAKILEINPETLKNYESGRRSLPFIVYYKLIQFLDIRL